jgi:TonB family protein
MKLSGAILLSIAVVATAQTGGVRYLSATDARGVKHVQNISDLKYLAFLPWKADLLFAPRPDYPRSERVQRNEGVAVIRLDIDIKTGSTTYVTLLKSSGFPKLDDAALRSLAKWRWKPGTWKQVEFPVIFTTSGHNLDGWYP